MTKNTPAKAAPDTPSDETGLALPHERDQSTDMTSAAPDPHIQQAHADLGRGLQDTDKSPAMDAAYSKLKRP